MCTQWHGVVQTAQADIVLPVCDMKALACEIIGGADAIPEFAFRWAHVALDASVEKQGWVVSGIGPELDLRAERERASEERAALTALKLLRNQCRPWYHGERSVEHDGRDNDDDDDGDDDHDDCGEWI